MIFNSPTSVDDSTPIKISTTKLKIVNLLQQISDHHELVAITFPESDAKFTSTILMVDASNEHLILDELKPEKGQSNIDTISLINIEGQVRGITSSFTSRLIHIEHAGGIKSHIMSFPTTINYKQKRIFYRVPVGYSKQYRVTLSMNNYQSYTGELRDLSLGGIRAIFPADAMINEGDIVASCLINFKNQPTISCPLKIRFSHPNNNDKMLIVGGSFLKISLQQERAIQRLVCALEREQLKKRI